MNKKIDLNCDLGEWKDEDGASIDEKIMPYISSCNVACGGHIGDEHSMISTINLALKHKVAIGAHPAYPDPANFGRKVLDINFDELRDSIIDQIGAFKRLVENVGAELHHIKPHGALYNEAAKNEEIAMVVISAIKTVSEGTPIYLPVNSISKKIAEDQGLRVITEAFADRKYENDLSLRSRSLEGAVLENTDSVLAQMNNIVLNGEVRTSQGQNMPIYAETICLHSDTKGSVLLAKTINEFLRTHGITITAT